MKTRDFVTERLWNLRAFFKARYGRGWYTKAGHRAGFGRIQCLLPSHIKELRTSFGSIARLEAEAVKLGYKLPPPSAPTPSERK